MRIRMTAAAAAMATAAVLFGALPAGAADAPACVPAEAAPPTCLPARRAAPPVRVVRVERSAPPRRARPVVRKAADPELYDAPTRQIVTDRRCVDDGDGVSCRYRRFFR